MPAASTSPYYSRLLAELAACVGLPDLNAHTLLSTLTDAPFVDTLDISLLDELALRTFPLAAQSDFSVNPITRRMHQQSECAWSFRYLGWLDETACSS